MNCQLSRIGWLLLFPRLKSAARRLALAGCLLLPTGCAIPVLNASGSGDTNTLALLLQQGHDANEAFPLIGTRPLMVAAVNGHLGVVQALLDAGADANAADWTGWTALHAGALNGDPAIVSLLLTRGAIPSQPRWFLRSPASIAEMLGHKDIIPLLKNAAALSPAPSRSEQQGHTP
ncbi:MAG: ankyrin repeat domain-containing protein [Nitrospira sp.]|nr:ankyrin repeat domain-containing protein [Nitrospira sp.]